MQFTITSHFFLVGGGNGLYLRKKLKSGCAAAHPAHLVPPAMLLHQLPVVRLVEWNWSEVKILCEGPNCYYFHLYHIKLNTTPGVIFLNRFFTPNCQWFLNQSEYIRQGIKGQHASKIPSKTDNTKKLEVTAINT